MAALAYFLLAQLKTLVLNFKAIHDLTFTYLKAWISPYEPSFTYSKSFSGDPFFQDGLLEEIRKTPVLAIDRKIIWLR